MSTMQKLLDEYNETPANLAKELDTTKASVYAWVKGIHIPQRGSVNMVLEHLGVPEEDRFKWKMKFKKERSEHRYG